MLSGIDMRIVDSQTGEQLPHDGVAVGDLQGMSSDDVTMTNDDVIGQKDWVHS